jgi:CheY-like chemotaxis protein
MSAPGEGTTMTLVLPKARHDQATLAPPPPAVAPQSAPAGSVLLVEDDDEVAALTTDLLEELGWRVTRAASGEAALKELAKSASFDLVFSDVMMPGGMNGLDLAQRIRDGAPKLPILLTSGYAAPVEREAAKAGLPLLAKPFTLDALSDALGQVLAR